MKDSTFKHLRDAVAVAKRVYPRGRHYRREPLNSLIKALEARVMKNEARPDAATKLEARRKELAEALQALKI